MAVLQLILGPDPILKQKAAPVVSFDETLKQKVSDMFETLYARGALGMGANMVGLLDQIVVIDLQENGKKAPLTLINPQRTWASEERREHEEASLCFPGIAAPVSRPASVKVEFQDMDGNTQNIEADGLLATVLQHEIDYLNGVIYLDYLSKMKRDRLIKKMQKQLKAHSCGDPHCGHDHH